MQDLIIIGGGVAGMGAAIYAKRFGMNVTVFAELLGGTITLTHLVENYPGFKSLSGLELANNIIDHAKSVGTEIINQQITEVTKNNDIFNLTAANGEKYEAKSIIFATGTKHKKLGVPGEAEFTNKGVSYCATCDGPFFKNKVVGIVGGSDSAVKESLLLAEHCKHVYIIYRGEQVRAEPINMDRMKSKNNIEVIKGSNVVEILGDNIINKVKLDTGKEIDLEGLFIEIGGIPRTKIAKDIGVELNEKSEIIIDKESRTNVPGAYAAGDCCNTAWKQAIVGVAEGTFAAYSAFSDLKSS
ncbi:FAD-dependent oxidoreductase [Patescibacteria group bacterium]|nr:FAD-dependent oxidoreductase [Patescibacteria group bacterium]